MKPSSETPTSEKSLLNTEAKPPEGEKKPAETKPDGAPEKYEDFEVPEGYTLDTTVATEAGALFKKHNLSQAAAQELVDFYSQHAIDSSKAALKAAQDIQDGWKTQMQKDYPEAFDAKGALKPDSKLLLGINRMLDSLGDAKRVMEFREAMDYTGAGNHPAFAWVFNRLAQLMGEGTSVRGNAPSPHGQTPSGTVQRKSAAQEMYPTLSSAAG